MKFGTEEDGVRDCKKAVAHFAKELLGDRYTDVTLRLKNGSE